MEEVEYAIIYNCSNNISSYKDINLSCDINMSITSDDDIIDEELNSYETSIYQIINYDESNHDEYDCDLILIPIDSTDTINLNKLKEFIKNKSEIIIVSKNEDFQNSVKEIISYADVMCYEDFRYIIEITNN